jgi:ABC-type glutathione transport system ATPase component
VEYVADRVTVMRGARIEELGDCAEVLQRTGSDFTRALLAAVPQLVGG